MTPIRALVYEANGHVYAFMWHLEFTDQVLRHISALAADPDIEFNWYNAAICSKIVRSHLAA